MGRCNVRGEGRSVAMFPRGCVGGTLSEGEGFLGAFPAFAVCSSWLRLSGWL